MWIFGYGSLLWYQDFVFEKKVPGIVRGFSRRFWQLSPDHRGTPESPGRTVTLVPNEKEYCWGIAFKVPDEAEAETRAYLDHREKAGYSCVKVLFEPDDKATQPFEVEVYMNVADKEHHAGPTDLLEIAKTILQSRGPSGPNIEYFVRLAVILRDEASAHADKHINDLMDVVVTHAQTLQMDDAFLRQHGFIV